jgi:hypothetical protein
MTDDAPDFGVNFETGQITRPEPEGSAPPTQIDETFDAFADEEPQPPGGQPAAPPRQAPEMLPKYQFDKVNEELRTAREERTKLLALIERLSTPQAPPPPSQPRTEADEARERVRKQLLAIMPELGEYIENKDRLLKAITLAEQLEPRIGAMQQDTERFWTAVADNALNGLIDGLSKHVGVAVDPNSRMARAARQEFFQYAASSPRNVARYEAQDPSLVTEFIRVFDQEVLALGRPRQAAPAGPPRTEQTRRLPVAGRTSPPPAAAPPKPDLNNEDEVLAAGWAHVLSQRQALTQ